jgi:hypothetical protein
MSYIKPSPQIYQELQNSGGVANSTPDLDTCIIGPLYNNLAYVPGSLASQIETAAKSTVYTTGSMTAKSALLTVTATGSIAVGAVALVPGAGLGAATLQAIVLGIAGNVITLDTVASTTVTDVLVSTKASITNPQASNTFSLPNQIPGQMVDASSINLVVSNAKVQTMLTGFLGQSGSSLLSVLIPSGITGTGTGGTNSLTLNSVSSANKLVVGDVISVAGTTFAGGGSSAIITSKTSTVLTLSAALVGTVNTAAVTKTIPSNLNSVTNTLRAEPGDTLSLSYVNTSGSSVLYSSVIRSVVTSTGNSGTMSTINAFDQMPADMSFVGVGTISLSTPTTLTLVSNPGFAAGQKIVVSGAGTSGSDLVTDITGLSGLTLTLLAGASTAVAGAAVISSPTVSLMVLKSYQDLVVPITRPISGGTSYNTTATGTTGNVVINPNPEVNFGQIASGDVYFGYRALRTDKTNQILTINNASDAAGQLGDLTDANPLGLGCIMALANTTGRIKAIAVGSEDLFGYEQALFTSQAERLYCIVPLTQDPSILEACSLHAIEQSTPDKAAWRVVVVNKAIPQNLDIGAASATNPTVGASIALSGSSYVLTSTASTFISDGISAGDTVKVVATSLGATNLSYTVLSIVSNQQLVISATSGATAVQLYISRPLTRSQQAAEVAASAHNYNSNRTWMVGPDVAGIEVDGVVKNLPGYYIACAHAGLVSGLPVQQGMTNIGVAGITNLVHSNYYFSKDDLNTMAAAGVCMYVQDSQTGTPYIRHALTTDTTVLEYREQLVVKNWDFLSYFYYDLVKSFIGTWNTTTATFGIIRQTIDAGSALLKSKPLPRIGPPLIDAKIKSMGQDPVNKDTGNVVMSVSVVYPLNYLNIYLVI